MTSHSYYKDRLGFDPNELQHEQHQQQQHSSNSMKRSSSRQTHHHHQSYHHATTTSSSPARISVSPGGNGSLEYHQVQREQRDRELYANGHSSSSHHHHHQQQHLQHQHSHSHSPHAHSQSPSHSHHRHSHGLIEASPAAKKAKHSSTQVQPQGGYEDALTQFKGSMSIWDHFIEDWDIMRKSAKVHFRSLVRCFVVPCCSLYVNRYSLQANRCTDYKLITTRFSL